jgi:hypothetical protein
LLKVANIVNANVNQIANIIHVTYLVMSIYCRIDDDFSNY